MEKAWAKRRRLVLVPCPFQGHINPMLHLANIHNNRPHILQLFLPLSSPAVHLPPPQRRPVPGSSWDLSSILLAVNDNYRASLEDELAAMAMGEESDAAVCIIHDELMYFCEAVASRFGVRSVVLRTAGAATCLSHLAIVQLYTQGCFPPLQRSLEGEVPELHHLRFKDLPLPITLDFFKFTKVILNMYTINTASAVIWNTVPWLEPYELTQIHTKLCKIPIFPIGQIHKIVSTSASVSAVWKN